MGINSVNDKFNDMDRVNEIIGHLIEEEYDAVLYGVMLRFLNNKAKEYNCDVSELLLSIAVTEINSCDIINLFLLYVNKAVF